MVGFPLAALVVYWLLPWASSPAGLEKVAIATWPIVSVNPLL